MKKILSLFLALTMVMSLCAITVSADATAIKDGSTVLYSYDSATKTLTLSGEGEVPNKLLTDSNGYMDADARKAEHIKVSGNISKIKAEAFNGSAMTSVTLSSESLTALESYPFINCQKLCGEIVIPKSVTSIGTNFLRQIGMNYVVMNDSQILGKTRGDLKDDATGKLVVKFAEGSTYKLTNNTIFAQAPTLRKIYLPSTVTVDEKVTKWEDLFGETQLVSSANDWRTMKLPNITIYTSNADVKTKLDSLTYTDAYYTGTPTVILTQEGIITDTISGLTNGSYEFNSSTGVLKINGTGDWTMSSAYTLSTKNTTVKTVEFANTITSIPASLFKNCCTGIETIVLPTGLKVLGNGAFQNNEIKKICYNDGTTEHLGFPEGLTRLEGGNFYVSTLSETVGSDGILTMPDSVEYIGAIEFANVNQIKMLRFNKTSKLKKFVSSAFMDMSGVIIELPSSVEEIEVILVKDTKDDRYGKPYAKNRSHVFTSSKAVQDMFNAAYWTEYPTSSTDTGFFKCHLVEDSQLPLTKWGSVSDLPRGKWIIFNDNELHIYGSGTYADSKYVTGTNYPWQSYIHDIEKLVFHNSIMNVPEDFGGNGSVKVATFDNLKELVLSNDMKSINRYAFANTRGVQTWKDDAQTQVGSYYNGSPITTIKHLDEDDSTELVGFPNKQFTTIGDQAFQNNYFIQGTNGNALVIPASVTSIGNGAFIYAFKSAISNKVTNLVFAKDSKLETIGTTAFMGCNLSMVEIPGSVTKIDYGAFQSNADGMSVYFEGNKPTIVSGYVTSSGEKYDAFNTKDAKIYYYTDTYTADDFGTVAVANGLTVADKLDPKLTVSVATAENNGNITATVTYRAPELMSGSQDYVLILAEYEGNVLQKADISKTGTITADMTNFETPITVSMTKNSDCTYKAFLWNSLGECVPVK